MILDMNAASIPNTSITPTGDPFHLLNHFHLKLILSYRWDLHGQGVQVTMQANVTTLVVVNSTNIKAFTLGADVVIDLQVLLPLPSRRIYYCMLWT